ncbi:MAG: beta-ketoacyl-ACP synthase II [Bifidobacteriaceae bacterium]|jgi:3-oxoacyl-[acyl-carrier-protein] synthase II|nr:beta-ketoacyl-ACP synthase II [Bifidobacteriaceae bacterium]
MTRRVVITGLGPLTAVGIGDSDFFAGWRAGRSGVRSITGFDTSALGVKIAAEVDLDPSLWFKKREILKLDRFAMFALIASGLALDDSGLLSSPAAKNGVVGTFIGTGAGGGDTMQGGVGSTPGDPAKLSPRWVPSRMANSASSLVSIRYGFTGPSLALVSACSSGADAIVCAAQAILAGEVDAALAGGVETPVNPHMVGGFWAMRALSVNNAIPEAASRPFSLDRDGFVLAEGAGVLVLEEREQALARGARVRAELVGFGRSSDAHHLITPSPDGIGAQRAMCGALDSGGITAGEVDYICAHGTATRLNDLTETRAIKAVFGEHAATTPVSSIKGLLGHSLGASAGIATIASVQSLETGIVPGTANLESADPELDLDYVSEGPRLVGPDTAMVNSNAFGGQNVSILVARPDSAACGRGSGSEDHLRRAVA